MKYVNLWVFFICKKMGRPFLQVPIPGGYERRRIINAYFEKSANKNKLRIDLFNWMYLTVWFGLRRKEVDYLHDKNLWRVEKLFNG